MGETCAKCAKELRSFADKHQSHWLLDRRYPNNIWKGKKLCYSCMVEVMKPRVRGTKCFNCGKEEPEFFSSRMPDGQFVDEQLTETQKTDEFTYVFCQNCETAWFEIKRKKGIEQQQGILARNWECPFCGLLNNGDKVFCEKCHAPRRR
jgi:hypothetical protein